MELLLQATWSKDHAHRLEPTRRYRDRLCCCKCSVKFLNPVARKGRVAAERSVSDATAAGWGDDLRPKRRPHPARPADAGLATLPFQGRDWSVLRRSPQLTGLCESQESNKIPRLTRAHALARSLIGLMVPH